MKTLIKLNIEDIYKEGNKYLYNVVKEEARYMKWFSLLSGMKLKIDCVELWLDDDMIHHVVKFEVNNHN